MEPDISTDITADISPVILSDNDRNFADAFRAALLGASQRPAPPRGSAANSIIVDDMDDSYLSPPFSGVVLENDSGRHGDYLPPPGTPIRFGDAVAAGREPNRDFMDAITPVREAATARDEAAALAFRNATDAVFRAANAAAGIGDAAAHTAAAAHAFEVATESRRREDFLRELSRSTRDQLTAHLGRPIGPQLHARLYAVLREAVYGPLLASVDPASGPLGGELVEFTVEFTAAPCVPSPLPVDAATGRPLREISLDCPATGSADVVAERD